MGFRSYGSPADAERRAQPGGHGFASSLFQAALGVSLASSNPYYPASKCNLLCASSGVFYALFEKLNCLIHWSVGSPGERHGVRTKIAGVTKDSLANR